MEARKQLIEKLLCQPDAELQFLVSEIECDIPYVFKKTETRDYLCDPFKWKTGPTKCIGEELRCTYYYLIIKNGTKPTTTNEFRKIVYQGKSSPNVVIVYHGKKELAKVLPHGNSKNGAPFIRTAGSTLKVLKEKSEKTSIMERYDELRQGTINDMPESLFGEEADKFIDHVAPRNPKQVKNHKYSQRVAGMLSQDRIYNA